MTADALPANATDAPPMLAVDAAGIAGRYSVSLRTVRGWGAAGKLPRGTKIGGRKLWSLPEIESWFAAGCPNRLEWQARQAAAKK